MSDSDDAEVPAEAKIRVLKERKVRLDDRLLVEKHLLHVLKKGGRVLAEIGKRRRVDFHFFVFG